MAIKLGLSAALVTTIHSAAALHDVGKIGIPDKILLKPGKLTAEEFELMKTHTQVGGRILGESDTPILQMATEIAVSHHEHWDGTGYPSRLKEQAIPLTGRIIAVADAFDAMTSARPYREPLSVGSALSDLVRLAPQKYDPNVVQALLIQVRRDAVGSSRAPLLADRVVNIAPGDIDQLAATLQHKVSRGRVYVSQP